MNRRDHFTNTEADAGRYDRAGAADYREWDLDDGTARPTTDHECSTTPHVDSCVGCLVWSRYWAKERAAVDAANGVEWWEGA